jgi:hypothetical protein
MSLEDERRALLDQIHSSRETYRRMLTQSDKRSWRHALGDRVAEVGHANRFPRSTTMRLVTQHPYASVAAAAALVLLGARASKTTAKHRSKHSSRQQLLDSPARRRAGLSSETLTLRRTARTRSTDFPQYGSTSASKKTLIRSALTGLATTGVMMLRDPKKMLAAANAFSAALNFLRAQRANKQQVRVVHHVKER